MRRQVDEIANRHVRAATIFVSFQLFTVLVNCIFSLLQKGEG